MVLCFLPLFEFFSTYTQANILCYKSQFLIPKKIFGDTHSYDVPQTHDVNEDIVSGYGTFRRSNHVSHV